MHLASNLERLVKNLNVSYYEDNDSFYEEDKEMLENYISKLESQEKYLVFDTLIETLNEILIRLERYYSSNKECRFKYLESIKVKVDDSLVLIDDFLFEINEMLD